MQNKMNLPETIVKAVSRQHHKRGDYSVTDLQKSAKQLWLSRRHEKEIETVVDISDKLWPLFGSAIHYVLEKGEDKNALQEEYLTSDIGGIKVTGMCDHFDGKILTDWKFTSVWSLVYKSSYADWERQLNMYAFLFGLAGFEVEKIQVITLLKDWSKTKAKSDSDYPQCQVQIIPLDLWPATKQRDYIEGRIAEFEKYKDVEDDKIPECTPENRWAKKDAWAVMKKGNKKAIRGGVKDTEKEAKELVLTDKDYYIQPRPGLDTKCLDYCDACQFCSYYKNNYVKKNKGS